MVAVEGLIKMPILHVIEPTKLPEPPVQLDLPIFEDDEEVEPQCDLENPEICDACQ